MNINNKESVISQIAALANKIPGVIIIHDLPNFSVQYMSPFGLTLLGKEWDEIKGMSSEEYHKRFFNEDDAKDYVPKLLNLLNENTDDVVPFFQQVRTSKERWPWPVKWIPVIIRGLKTERLILLSRL